MREKSSGKVDGSKEKSSQAGKGKLAGRLHNIMVLLFVSGAINLRADHLSQGRLNEAFQLPCHANLHK